MLSMALSRLGEKAGRDIGERDEDEEGERRHRAEGGERGGGKEKSRSRWERLFHCRAHAGSPGPWGVCL